ncbi:MAG: NUDIX domain-containing protein [Bacillota bacterium]|nr:NUDIX domain-containing protein [Bacillota bacterium]HOL52428.1 NUDIX domain-containing protein [Bacillota bacterium]HPQ03553.1 NUDIX domain-containing protein [Bacillota bacterium]HPZ14484.1 NUDIX domain-containing protein [Bacillota bacterium]
MVVPVTDGELLLVRNVRRAGWEFPGGQIEQGESPEEAARRELLEEAGALVDDLKPLCWYTVTNGVNSSKGIVYIAYVLAVGKPSDVQEIAEVKSFGKPPAELSFKDGFIELVFKLMEGSSP